MDDDEQYEETEELTGTPNWADWANVFICVPFYLFKGLFKMVENANAMLALHSRNIDAKKDFSNSVHEALESLDREDEN